MSYEFFKILANQTKYKAYTGGYRVTSIKFVGDLCFVATDNPAKRGSFVLTKAQIENAKVARPGAFIFEKLRLVEFYPI